MGSRARARVVSWVPAIAVWVVAVGSLLIIAVNVVAMPRLANAASLGAHRSRQRISVLIPARNEVDQILASVGSALAQDGVDVEVIVLDDRSDDGTLARLETIDDDRLHIVAGATLPEGWTGKNWACHQLSGRASHDLLCFLDADTRLTPGALAAVCDVLDRERADLVSCLVAADYRSAAQRTLLPMVNHALLALFPVALMHVSRFPRVALALGPFIAVRRDAYESVGGHAAHPDEIVDDVRLARSVKRSGGRVRLANGTNSITTRWYPDLGGIWRGFSKNAYGAIESSPVLAALTCLALVPLLVAPFVQAAIGVATGDVAAAPVIQCGLLVGGRLVTARLGRDPVASSILHPVAVVFWGATLARSAQLSHGRRSVEWRGRSVPVARR